MKRMKLRAGALVALVGIAAPAVFGACGGEQASPSANDAGSSSSGASGSNASSGASGSGSSSSSGTSGTSGTGGSSGTSGASGTSGTSGSSGSSGTSGSSGDGGQSTLYDRLGGHSGIKQILTDVLVHLLQDPHQKTYFVLNAPPLGLHPSGADIIECFTALLDSAVPGGPGTPYPPAPLASGYTCRGLAEAHHGMLADGGTSRADELNYRIPNGIFNDFVLIAAATAASAPHNIKPADVNALGALLGSTRASVVDPSQPDSGDFDASAYTD